MLRAALNLPLEFFNIIGNLGTGYRSVSTRFHEETTTNEVLGVKACVFGARHDI